MAKTVKVWTIVDANGDFTLCGGCPLIYNVKKDAQWIADDNDEWRAAPATLTLEKKAK